MIQAAIGRAYLRGDCKSIAVGLPLLQEPTDNRPNKWRGIMKALIAALELVTLIASPTFAQSASNDTGAASCYGRGFGPSSPCYP
jgi:hypothetical protein